jgi:pyruvate ferredoxin oxidoreductase gamma subunit
VIPDGLATGGSENRLLMLQVRIHGRGGQGVVTAAELLSVAAFLENRHAQAFPSFGSERTGAPVVAYCRIADRPIRTREPIAEPDVLIVQDPTLVHQVDLFAGLRDGGTILVNTTRTVDELGLGELRARHRVLTVPATELAREHLGRPLPNAALLGAFAAVTGAVSIESVAEAIRERFHGQAAAGNEAAARAAHDAVHATASEPARA